MKQPNGTAIGPPEPSIGSWTDRYFLKTKKTIGRFGDKTESWNEADATADIVAYAGKPSAKVGREFPIKGRGVRLAVE